MRNVGTRRHADAVLQVAVDLQREADAHVASDPLATELCGGEVAVRRALDAYLRCIAPTSLAVFIRGHDVPCEVLRGCKITCVYSLKAVSLQVRSTEPAQYILGGFDGVTARQQVSGRQ